MKFHEWVAGYDPAFARTIVHVQWDRHTNVLFVDSYAPWIDCALVQNAANRSLDFSVRIRSTLSKSSNRPAPPPLSDNERFALRMRDRRGDAGASDASTADAQAIDAGAMTIAEVREARQLPAIGAPHVLTGRGGAKR